MSDPVEVAEAPGAEDGAIMPLATEPGPLEQAIRERLSVKHFSTDSDWTYEIHADGVQIASGNPPGNPQTLAGSTAKIDEMVARANAVPTLLSALNAERAARVEAEEKLAEVRAAVTPLGNAYLKPDGLKDHERVDPLFPVTAGDLRRLAAAFEESGHE